MLIKIINLTKKYGNKSIFSNLNLNIDNQKYYFLTGSNGCGKTTFIKCLLNQTQYKGTIDKVKLKFSYAPDKITFPPLMKPYDFLILLGKTKNANISSLTLKLAYLINLFKLDIDINKPFNNLSFGTKQKINLIQALMLENDVYIFDEPLNGLDYEAQITFTNLLIKLYEAKKIIIVITHQSKLFTFSNIKNIFFQEGKIIC